jgi:hypothetical protein
MRSQSDIDAAQRAARERYDLHCLTFSAIEGAASLNAIYGDVTSFHDADLLDVNLSRGRPNTLRISNPYPDIFGAGRVIVTLEIAEVVHLELSGSSFSILFGLYVTPAGPDPRNEPYYGRPRRPGDLRIELESTAGLGGVLIASGLTLTWKKDRKARALRSMPPDAGPKLAP